METNESQEAQARVKVKPGCNLMEKVDGKFRRFTNGQEFTTSLVRAKSLGSTIDIVDVIDPPTIDGQSAKPKGGRPRTRTAPPDLDRMVHPGDGDSETRSA